MSQSSGPPGHLLSPVEGRAITERLQQAAARATFLSRATTGLSGAMHVHRAVDTVLEMLTGSIVEWAQVTLLDRRRYVFRGRSLDGTAAQDQLPIAAISSFSSLGRVLATGVSDLVLVPDGEDVDSAAVVSAVPCRPLRATLSDLRPMDLLSIALTARSQTYGALTIARRGDAGFDEEAVSFLEDFADRVAVTLDTTRALAESRRVAAVLAQDLTPPTLPTLTGIEFATYYRVAFEHEALGGDFYDVHGDDQEWTAVMGDVCGKGVEAAVLTGKVRQAIRTAALIDRDPASMLELANRVLLIDGADTFVTVLAARGRRVDGSVHLDVAAAGHPSPFVVRRDGSVERLEVRGTVLGLLPRTTYTSAHVVLAPGETCLMFTDGVPEAPGRRGRFGEDGMRDVLAATGACAPRAQVEAVAVAVAAHLQDRPHDDIAMLAVQASPGTA